MTEQVVFYSVETQDKCERVNDRSEVEGHGRRRERRRHMEDLQ